MGGRLRPTNKEEETSLREGDQRATILMVLGIRSHVRTMDRKATQARGV